MRRPLQSSPPAAERDGFSNRLRPTRLGVAFLGLIVLTLIGCVNYGLSLGYGVTFLLGGVWVVTATGVSRAGRALRATLTPPGEAVAGGTATFTAVVTSTGPASLAAVWVGGRGSPEARGHVPAGGQLRLTLPVPTPTRGRLTLARPRVVALDPLGLWEVTRPLPVPEALTVFPAPEPGAPSPPPRPAAGEGEGGRRAPGDEEFSGLRAYLPGDSPRRVSWRHAARTGTLLTRETDAPVGTAAMLDWADTAALGDPEARLARLAAWVGAARRADTPFGLTLPSVALPVGRGETQARAALTALALHGTPPTPTQGRRVKTVPPLPGGPLRLTLLALAVALAPVAPRQPVWATLGLVAVLGYAAARTLPRWNRLPAVLAPLLALLAVGSAALLNSQYGTLLGRDAGTAFLALLVAMKAAETRTVRDARLLALLGVFVTLTHFFFGQGPLAAVHAGLSVLLLLGALVGWTALPGPAVVRPLRVAAGVTARAAPLALVLFVLFPRPDGPLWQLPVQSGAQTGLADRIRAGEFGTLAQSPAVAFRADFGGAVPAPAERYWRGPVYEAYDGAEWTQVRLRGPSPSVEVSGPTLTYTLTLEPGSGPWLTALDVPTALPPNVFLTSAFQAVNPRPATSRTRYAFQSRAARLGVTESRERLEFNLRLPDGESPRARSLAAQWRSLTPEARVEAALAYLRSGGFTYTLQPPTLPERDRVDAFLFGTRRGFCEHYASAFAFLIRAAGLPARVVGGYLGGEVNPDGGYLIVRAQDAHAWAEVWLPGQGWVRVDPTAAIAPARVNAGLATALTTPTAQAAPPPTPLRRAALRLDALQTRWNTWVAGYDGSRQRDLFTSVGVGRVGGVPYLALGAGLLLLALLPALLAARSRPADPAARLLDDLARRLRLPRAPGETASAYAGRAALAYPIRAEAINAAVSAYQKARYAPDAGGEALRELRAAVRRVRR
ncbi:transglutaminaseTgpA domain-containing protein [Deinococcus sp. YIM 134068]|uniref:transglutaminaseTgpA domain-containing protein n=1 Tax=Deinococcus lichenicola TaxID=3118910 RepID=UPI002F93520C